MPRKKKTDTQASQEILANHLLMSVEKDEEILIGKIEGKEIKLVLKEENPELHITFANEIDLTQLAKEAFKISQLTVEGNEIVGRGNANQLIDFCLALEKAGIFQRQLGVNLHLLRDDLMKFYANVYAKKFKE
jgi:hypothetical protein